MSISKFTAGALHENHKALIAKGPWVFGGIEPARYEARPDGEGGTCEVPMCAGTCDLCGQAICDVVRLRHATNGETRMIGVDCAATYLGNLGKAFRDAKTGLMRVKRETTTRRKAEKLSEVLAPLRAEMAEWSTEETFRASVARNALRVMDKGRRPSPEHMALIAKCREEGPGRSTAPRAPRPVREEERHVAAPEGRQTVRGVVISTKSEEKCFNGVASWSHRMTVKVATDDGVYLVNGTAPRALLDEAFERLACPEGSLPALRGCVVEFVATLARSDRDEHFAFAERPAKARLVSWPEGTERARAA